jgi:hypothetical protein
MLSGVSFNFCKRSYFCAVAVYFVSRSFVGTGVGCEVVELNRKL